MGQRYLQLDSTYTGYESNTTAVLHVSQLPPNPAILAPGPALLFVVVAGVPSVGVQVMIGSGQLGTQPTSAIGPIPSPTMVPSSSDIESPTPTPPASQSQSKPQNSSSCRRRVGFDILLAAFSALAATTILLHC